MLPARQLGQDRSEVPHVEDVVDHGDVAHPPPFGDGLDLGQHAGPGPLRNAIDSPFRPQTRQLVLGPPPAAPGRLEEHAGCDVIGRTTLGQVTEVGSEVGVG